MRWTLLLDGCRQPTSTDSSFFCKSHVMNSERGCEVVQLQRESPNVKVALSLMARRDVERRRDSERLGGTGNPCSSSKVSRQKER